MTAAVPAFPWRPLVPKVCGRPLGGWWEQAGWPIAYCAVFGPAAQLRQGRHSLQGSSPGWSLRMERASPRKWAPRLCRVFHHEMRSTPGIPVIHTGPREADRAPRRRTGLDAWGPFTRRRSREVRGHNRLELRMQQDWIGANQLHELRRRRCRARRFRHPRSLTGRSSSRVGLLVRWISLETALTSGSSPDLALQALDW